LKDGDDKSGSPAQEAGIMSGFFKMVKKQFGYSPTSRKCLEYQEALYITGKQINYIEVRFNTIIKILH
jgi:hypothetical protein